MKRKLASLAALATASALVLAGCSSNAEAGDAAGADNSGKTITLWLAGGDTPDALRDYLKSEFNKETGAKLNIQQQDWGDLVTKLTTSLPDANNTPDVTEMGNTQSPTFTNVGAFLDITDMYDELGGEKLLQSFVDAGTVGDANYTLPYYFGSRAVFTRSDVWTAAGVEQPKTLDEFNAAVATISQTNPLAIPGFSGFYLGGQDWRNGISWIFANGGELATVKDGTWTSTLASDNTQKGLAQLQELYKSASNAPNDAKDSNQYIYLNDSDEIKDADGAVTSSTSLAAASIMAPTWAHWSIGTLGTDAEGKATRTWDDTKNRVFALPGNDGKPAPVFAGGSNIGISAKSKNPALAKSLMKIIFSEDYQNMLGKNGLGPANSDYVNSLGDDQFAKALIESASNSKLTPAAPGWATVEGSLVLEEFFSKIKDSTDLAALAAEYDKKITPMLNGK
ncbi:extracellular solute-binding protein [Glaciibacter psychrotolerans]|uniref:N,N'-diacetylchitobiose transport system substrate-binding protein n=1 Tax=Glaciibacter psychrotolerans TaxID=670054 RepID=A0A7Z0J887_9MICO|nr:extracellular solute-binding protein [Leifsonia psychrotolerans]NYJ21649.1 N,N'-diacetylchitobiose transport system substrate-binding protein [Leifsonia psychrotolerans]